jgi:hypothetical protein
MDENTVTVRLSVDVETGGDTDAEELGWMLNMLRDELRRWPHWRTKIRGVKFLRTATQEVRPTAIPRAATSA